MAKNIMIQGTMSGAGKSLLVTGLCRIFQQEGYRVAPFKSQNMALNSYITREGLEMGRAQAVQAQAAGIEPTVNMNPILLKPTSDVGSQVIVNGEVVGNMSAREYFAYKKSLLGNIKQAYDALAAEYDIIVIEGAGSPAEINLKENDIVNMGLAELVDAPVLLAGDIDRGGVFAQLLGTVELLEEKERARIKGLIINKFRGDVSILEPGIAQLRKYLDIPVVGVTPYLKVDIEDEDSQSSRLDKKNQPGCIDFAVVRLPHMANYTDFLILEQLPQVSLRYVAHPEKLGTPDMIFLPGSKNTMGDMAWLRSSGMEAAIAGAYEKGSVLFGICGGYQLLGRSLSDPGRVESGGSIRGLGYLPVDTVYQKEKIRTRVRGHLETLPGVLSAMSGQRINGYEIHMGVTKACEPTAALTELTDEKTGERKADGAVGDRVYGTYVHGIFDREGVADALAHIFAQKKGIKPERGAESMEQYRQGQFDLLADALREHLDLHTIYEVMGL
jgi:adenosylcobyric acid synthase